MFLPSRRCSVFLPLSVSWTHVVRAQPSTHSSGFLPSCHTGGGCCSGTVKSCHRGCFLELQPCCRRNKPQRQERIPWSTEHLKQIWKTNSNRLQSKWNSWHHSKTAWKCHFPPSLGGGKEDIQVSLNKMDHLNVKPLSTYSIPPGRRSSALAGLPEEVHRKVRRALAMARTQQARNWTSATLTSSCSSQCKTAATNIPLKLQHLRRGQNYSSHQPYQALLILSSEQDYSGKRSSVLSPKWMQTSCQQPAALFGTELLVDLSVLWWPCGNYKTWYWYYWHYSVMSHGRLLCCKKTIMWRNTDPQQKKSKPIIKIKNIKIKN